MSYQIYLTIQNDASILSLLLDRDVNQEMYTYLYANYLFEPIKRVERRQEISTYVTVCL